MSAELLARVQNAARHGRIKLTDHGSGEAANARAQAEDIRRAILTATSATAQEQGKVRLEGGVDLDGDVLTVVVREMPYGLRIITVF